MIGEHYEGFGIAKPKAHRPSWMSLQNPIMPDMNAVHGRIAEVASKSLERARGSGVPCCRKRR
ncbi:MAG: hypothetical protein PHX61_02275 [Alphaproteobacteria bacterium]|nr:hypothetical protein [Alphaproteobacteria bacterium]